MMPIRPNAQTISQGEVPILNTCRWVSAALVAFGHVFLLVYPAFSFHTAKVGAILVAVAKIRYLAVTVFFVVSGYLIGGGILVNKNPFSWGRYISHRFARIYTALIPALVLTFLLDHVAMMLDPHAFIYAEPWPTHVIGDSPPWQNYDFADVFGSVFSLESFVGKPLGSNSPLWSLGLEWCFYFIFPAVIVFWNLRKLVWQILGIAVVTFLLWFIIRDLCGYWVIWCSGALARRWLASRVNGRAAIAAALVMIVAVASSFVSDPIFRTATFALFGIGMAILLQNATVLRMNLGRRSDKLLADFSYSLYISHVPIAVFCVFLATTYRGMPTSGYPTLMQGAGLFALTMLVAFSVAWLFGICFEQRTAQVREFLQSLGPRVRQEGMKRKVNEADGGGPAEIIPIAPSGPPWQ